MSNAIEYAIIEKSLGVFTNKKGEKIEFIEEVNKIVSIKFPDGVWGIIKEFMITYTHKQLTYENDYNYDSEDEDDIIKKQNNIPNYVCILWDYRNDTLDNIISNDIRYNPDHKQNLMWIETIKKRNNWKKGEELYLSFKCNCDGAFYVWGYKTLQGYNNDMMIDTNGVVNVFRGKWTKEVDCMYNDLLKLSS